MYRRPRAVIGELLAEGQREDRNIMYLMVACAIMFVSQLPRLSRQAHLDGSDLNMLMGGALMGWVFLAPLFFYGLATLSRIIARLFGGRGKPWSARLSLFWALLAAAPLMLLVGLTAGFVGPGPQQNLVGALWSVAFLVFWGLGLRASERKVAQ